MLRCSTHYFIMFYAATGEDDVNDVKVEAIPIGEFLHGQYKVRILHIFALSTLILSLMTSLANII